MFSVARVSPFVQPVDGIGVQPSIPSHPEASMTRSHETQRLWSSTGMV